ANAISSGLTPLAAQNFLTASRSCRSPSEAVLRFGSRRTKWPFQTTRSETKSRLASPVTLTRSLARARVLKVYAPMRTLTRAVAQAKPTVAKLFTVAPFYAVDPRGHGTS